jgi:hypothetical protein
MRGHDSVLHSSGILVRRRLASRAILTFSMKQGVLKAEESKVRCLVIPFLAIVFSGHKLDFKIKDQRFFCRKAAR